MRKMRLLITSVICLLGFVSGVSAQVNLITTYIGNGTGGYAGDGGPATAATVRVNTPGMLNFDPSGNLYICDNSNNRLRKVDMTTGIISLVAGSGATGVGGDGAAATACQFGAGGGFNPGVAGVAVDGSGNIYVSDGTNNKIRKIDGAGIITTFAGTGTAGATGDGGPASSALLSAPRGLFIASNKLYIADANNNKIRVIDLATNTISLVAGTGTAGAAGDGGSAATAQLNAPRGVCVDASGNIFIADRSNNKVRKITTGTNIISTYAGNGTGGYAGDNGPSTAATCQVNRPTDVKIDAAGNLFISDNGNGVVRMVSAAGIITTVAGTSGFGGAAGDGGPATASAVRVNPFGLAVTDINHFYIADFNNSRIRQVKPNSIPYFVNGSPQSLTVCQSSGANSINSILAVMDSNTSQTLTWSISAICAHGTLAASTTAPSTGSVVTPTGLTYTPTVGYSGTDAFTIQISDGYNTSTTVVNVTVNPLPVVAAISGSATEVCVGSNIVLTDATTGGTWTSTTGNASVVGGTVTGVTVGTDDISYTVTNTCGSASAIYSITVNPLPNAGSITGASTVCVGASIPLADAAPGGTWSAQNANASVDGLGNVTGVTVGTDNISYTVTNTCGTVSAVHTVTVNDVPVVPAITGTLVVCEAATTLLSNTTPGGSWSATNANATVSGTGLVTGVTAGTDDISYTVTNGCGATSVGVVVTINPLPVAGTITGTPTVCTGGTVTLTDAAPGGTWSTTTGNATVSGGVVTGVTVGADVVSYSVTNSCGTAVATYSVNVVSVPTAGTITGPTHVCPGSTITLSDATSGGTWSASNANATVSGLGVVTGVTSGTDVISYSVVASCGTAVATFTVTIDPLPNAGTIVGSTNVCVGSSITLTDAVPGGTWSASNANATVSSTGVVTGVTAGAVTISYSVTGVCGTIAAILNINVNPIVTPSVTFTATPGFNTCPGTLVTYTANPVNGGTAPVYEWRVNGFVLGAGASFNHTPSNGDRFILKMTSNAACASITTVYDTVTVVVYPSLVPSVHISTGIIGDTVCIGDLTPFTAVPVNGGITPAYTWYVNGTAAGGGNPFTYAPTNGDIVTCALSSSYVCPTPATVLSNSVTMTVNTTETPAVGITVSPIAAVCIGTNVTFTAHPLYGGVPPTYTWTKNGVNVATGVNYTYSPTNGDNVYCTMASSASCRTVNTVTSNHINMNVENPLAIAVSITQSTGLIGVGQTDVFTAIVTSLAPVPTYQWFLNGTAVAGATNATYTLTGAAPGTAVVHCVAGSGDACYTTASSNSLTVTTAALGVHEYSASLSELKVVPNPNKGTFTLNLTSIENEQVHIVITNVVGETVKVLNAATNNDVQISMDQPSGIYLLTAVTEHGTFVQKVVIN